MADARMPSSRICCSTRVKARVSIGVIEINALVEESLNLAWHGARAETQGFEIKLKQAFDPWVGAADVFPQDIRRALLNVISNGFYAATRRRAETNVGDYEPTLAAFTKNLGDRVEITIRDNGTGMTPDVKDTTSSSSSTEAQLKLRHGRASSLRSELFCRASLCSSEDGPMSAFGP